MRNGYSYVLLETASIKKEFYYCLSNDTVYEAQSSYGKIHYPLLLFTICVPMGAILALVLYALYSRTSSNIVWLYIGLATLFACVLVCANDYFKRQRKTNLIKSQKSLAYFCSYLTLIKSKYRIQKRAAIICSLMMLIFVYYIYESPFLGLVFFSFCATSMYFLIFRVGIFNKKKVIERIQIIEKVDI